MIRHTLAAFAFTFPGRAVVAVVLFACEFRAFRNHATGIQLLAAAAAVAWIVILLRHYRVI